MARITINDIYFDPEAESDAVSNVQLDSADSSGSNYALVQTDAPLTGQQKAQLRSLGAEILEYHPENAYVLGYPPASLVALKALPFVKFAGVYPRQVKIAPQIRSSSAAAAESIFALPSVETSMSQQPVDVDVVMHNDVDANAVRDKVALAARLDPQSIRADDRKIRLTVQPQHLEDIAAIDEVKVVQPVDEHKLFNNLAITLIGADRVHNHASLDGGDEIVAVCDTGFDKGSTSDVHSAFTGRVLRLYSLGRPGNANDPNGHGTHVAGSVLGNGTSAAMGGAIRGTAPSARLVLQAVLDSNGRLGGLPADLKKLFEAPYVNDGARVHTNSWGSAVNGIYTRSAEEVDEFAFSHRDMVICFAAGNEGKDLNGDGVVDAGSIGSPGTAKNCITVGASESARAAMSKAYGTPWPKSFPSAPIAGDLWADNPGGIAAFSSRGPTRQARIKPDVVAPGTAILSAHSRDAHVGAFWGASSDASYCFMGGTSMATPLVAGCAAVLRQFVRRRTGVEASAALVKALLINGAEDLAGQYVPSEAGAIPNPSEGFGRVNLMASVGRDPAVLNLEWRDEHTALDTGDEESLTVQATAKGSIKATLVWCDPPGTALQNDLDLIVRSGGQESHGNMPSGVAAFDRTNNVEQVVWEALPDATVQVVVRAHRVSLHPQTYALVIRLG